MKKTRIMALVLAAVLLLAAVPMAALADTPTIKYVKTGTGGSVNMRYGAGTNYAIITTVPYGTGVTVYSTVNGWSQVGYSGYSGTGWIMSRYLVSSKPSKGTTKGSTADTLTSSIFNNFKEVNAYTTVKPSTPGNFVNMRWAPSKASPVQAKYYEGKQLLVLKENKSWCQVYDAENNRCGFIMKKLLDR